MRLVRIFLSLCLLLCLVALSLISVQAKQIRYQFRFLTQGANAYAPAKSRRIQLKFKNSPKITLSASTDSQGMAVFRTARCNEDDPAELIYRSDLPKKTLFRVPVTISCGTEDAKASSYSFGIYSLTYGKFLAIIFDDLDGPCYQCKLD
ncbi:MAG: hypothetical protein ACR2MG_01050 [Pyrinomonadaceae bacterium]